MRAEPGLFQTGLCYNQTDPTADLPAPLRLRFDGSQAPRPVHPREIHQGANGRQEARCRIFRALPERPLPDRGRELAPPAIAEYRIHDEEAARADRGWGTIHNIVLRSQPGRRIQGRIVNLLTSRCRDLSYSSETLCTVGSNSGVWIMWTLHEFIACGFLVAVALAGLGMLTLVFV